MKEDIFVVIRWPESQELFDLDGFRENSILINEEPLFSKYGSSAYLVNKEWLDKQDYDTNNKSI